MKSLKLFANVKNEFNIISKNSVIKLPNMLGFIAYHLDKAIQSTSYYNKEIHVLSEMTRQSHVQ